MIFADKSVSNKSARIGTFNARFFLNSSGENFVIIAESLKSER